MLEKYVRNVSKVIIYNAHGISRDLYEKYSGTTLNSIYKNSCIPPTYFFHKFTPIILEICWKYLIYTIVHVSHNSYPFYLRVMVNNIGEIYDIFLL
jgi:hypothetical protein